MCALILLKNPLCALTKSWQINEPKQDFKVWNIFPGVLAVLKYDIIYSDLTLSAILVQLILVYSLL